MTNSDPTTGEWVGEYETRDSTGEVSRLTEWFATEGEALQFSQNGPRRHPRCDLFECQDDCNERAECGGRPEGGHGYCGMCPTHNRPRHACGCFKGQVN